VTLLKPLQSHTSVPSLRDLDTVVTWAIAAEMRLWEFPRGLLIDVQSVEWCSNYMPSSLGGKPGHVSCRSLDWWVCYESHVQISFGTRQISIRRLENLWRPGLLIHFLVPYSRQLSFGLTRQGFPNCHELCRSLGVNIRLETDFTDGNSAQDHKSIKICHLTPFRWKYDRYIHRCWMTCVTKSKNKHTLSYIFHPQDHKSGLFDV
jgi:hypothetical protein